MERRSKGRSRRVTAGVRVACLVGLVLAPVVRAGEEDGPTAGGAPLTTALRTFSPDRSRSFELRPAPEDPFAMWIGAAKRGAEVAWTRRFADQPLHVAVGNDGHVALAAERRFPAIEEEGMAWVLELRDEQGADVLIDRLPTAYPSFDSVPFPIITGVFLHETLDRLSFVVVPAPDAKPNGRLRSYRISTGELLGEMELAPPAGLPEHFDHVRACCEVPGTPLTLVQWRHWSVETRRAPGYREWISLLDEEAREVWSEALPSIPVEWSWYGDGAVIGPERERCFSLFSPSDGTNSIFEVTAAASPDTGWKVSEPQRVATTEHEGWRAGPTPEVELERVGEIALEVGDDRITAGPMIATHDGRILFFDAQRGEVRAFRRDGSALPLRYSAASKSSIPRGSRLVLGPAGEVFVQRDHFRDDWVRFGADGSDRKTVALGGPCAAFLPDGRRVVAKRGILLLHDEQGTVTEAIAARPDGHPLREVLDVATAQDGTVYVLDSQKFFIEGGPSIWVLCEYTPDLEPTGMWSLPLRRFHPFGDVRLGTSPSHVLLQDARSSNALVLDRKLRDLRALSIPRAEEEDMEWNACPGPEGELWVLRAPEGVVERYCLK